ncbi:hypothetical protein CU102_12465 [Phyllobacterium brassicacearum]|uniref:Uncharacterized protein n=1 Tax=Phyllobacterium brassicacearum TaxID=314235 RepID=A0A2P7BQ22_9HYPH|nr:hypothetical protein CU102_12465 [Phyllobacterium brassicacearum]
MVNKRTDGSETDTEATTEVSESDGDHDADGFELIGVLAECILSRAKARKKTEEANAVASSVSFCSQHRGEQGGVGCNSVVKVDVRARILRNGVSLAGHANENFRTEQPIK